MPTIEFWFDYSCPYAYLASVQVQALAARTGADLIWKPFLLGGVFRALAQPQILPMSPQKARYLLADQVREAERLGVGLSHPAEHPRRTVAALRATLARACDPRLIHAFYRAYWVEGRALEDEAVVRSIVEETLGPGPLDLDAERDPLKANTDEALARGVFGAPACFVDGELYWGEDRLWMVERALRRSTAGRPEGGRWPEASRPAARTARRLDFYFDFASPFAYLASTQVEALAARTGAELHLRPVLLGAIFKAVGQVDAPIFSFPEAKRQFTLADLGRWAEHWGVTLAWPAVFPLRTVLPLRVWLMEPTAARMHTLFAAAWGRGEDVADPAVLARIGIPPAHIAEAASQKESLHASTAAALQAGAFGVPSWVVDGRLYWGQDRLHHVEAALRGWSPSV